MLFKLSNLNSNVALTLGYLNPALNNSAQVFILYRLPQVYYTLVWCEEVSALDLKSRARTLLNLFDPSPVFTPFSTCLGKQSFFWEV